LFITFIESYGSSSFLLFEFFPQNFSTKLKQVLILFF
jgi:hypothetical protein